MASKKLNVVIMGAGEVGKGLAIGLSSQGHDITLIDLQSSLLSEIETRVDLLTVTGSGADLQTLKRANIQSADLFIAVSSSDEHNLLACAAAKQYGVQTTIARIRTEDFISHDRECYQKALNIDLIINPDEVTAQELHDVILNPVASSVKEFAKGKVKLIGFRLKPDAPICNHMLKEIPELGYDKSLLIACVVRGHDVIIPRGEFTLYANDMIYVIADADSMKYINKMGGIKNDSVNKVVVVGASRVSQFLAEKFDQESIRLLVIDYDKDTCEKFATEIKNITMLNGDATDVALLKESGVADADSFIALSQDDETNILSCLLAKEQGAKRVIVLIRKPQYIPLLEHIQPIDVSINPRTSTIHSIMRYIRKGESVAMTIFADDKAEAVEVVVSNDSPLAGKKIREINIPNQVLLGAILRDDDVIIPKGENELKANDRVIVIGLRETVEKMDKLISSSDKPASLREMFKSISNAITGNGKNSKSAKNN